MGIEVRWEKRTMREIRGTSEFTALKLRGGPESIGIALDEHGRAKVGERISYLPFCSGGGAFLPCLSSAIHI